MKISALQIDIQWGDTAFNTSKIEAFIAVSDADLIILPEMFATGFSMKPEKIAQSMDGQCVIWMQQTAKKYCKGIMGSVAIKEGDYYVNRLIFADDKGVIDYIDKRHLFRMAGEEKVYRGGSERKIFTFKGIRILPQVCYDIRFPVWSRNIELQYDMIIYVASWPDARIFAWDTLLKARAIENQAYVVGVNRVGEDKAGYYSGHSAVLDFMGRDISRAEDDNEQVVTAVISLDMLREFRKAFPAYLDADKFELIVK